eukprot:TRINITY_DN1489_c0_g1_i1.p1 TRINITY_DN1489_c0_g1~~TRINITY_DN1489_c0_g1_i1.p1  ORF type:complete len:816 (+),score=81.81 TRINITY_DN1489_c0_g1_i1:174-2621(+)
MCFLIFFIVVVLYPPVYGSDEPFRGVKSLGCFKDDSKSPDLEYVSTLSLRGGEILEECIQDCVEHYYAFAGVQKGKTCFCGSQYGKYGASSDCKIPCDERDSSNFTCGGLFSSNIYSTGLSVSPGVLTDLYLNKSRPNQLVVSWDVPSDEDNDIIGYTIRATVKKSFDASAYSLGSTELLLSDSASDATILGLLPGTQYNVSVRAQNSKGNGSEVSSLFWTEIAKPEIPNPPILINSEEDKQKGILRIKVKPLEKNRYGPISKYRIVVIDESENVPVYPDSYTDWFTANKKNLKYWIAGELEPNYFNANDEFVVGDQKYYGKYFNYGPLNTTAENSDYHVTLGVVSRHEDQTKISYARVTHDQHSLENLVVFSFDSHENSSHDSGTSLVVSLSIAIIVFGLILGVIAGVYAYLRCGVNFLNKKNTRNSDAQELTPRKSTSERVDAEEIGLSFTNPMVSHRSNQDQIHSPASSSSQMEAIRRQVWLIPRVSLELNTSDVIGHGKYGSFVNGQIVKKSSFSSPTADSNFRVVVQVGTSIENQRSLTGDLELVVRYGNHANIVHLLGLSDGEELMNKTLFIVFEKTNQSLKRVLVDSRALLHYPVYAEKNNRFTTLQENNVLSALIGVSRGMKHLAENKIIHKKLCAKNIFLSPENIPKISGVGVAECWDTGRENDYTRWFAQDGMDGNENTSKFDVWSFGILMWEVITLGATPYADLKTNLVKNRVKRGARVPQTNYMSDDIYQVMLKCWQVDLEERASFKELEEILYSYLMQQETNKHISFENYSGFQYEMYVPELEVKSTTFPGGNNGSNNAPGV